MIHTMIITLHKLISIANHIVYDYDAESLAVVKLFKLVLDF